MQDFTPDRSTADLLDSQDSLASLKAQFLIPTKPDGSQKTYLVGNSLGLPTGATVVYVNEELERWARIGVEGHFDGEMAWTSYHSLMADQMSMIVGGQPDEVTVMNTLTVNLHLLMVSFYEPTLERHKILIEDHAFPSDHFAVESQIRQRGYDPDSSLVLVAPRDGEETLNIDDLLAAIAEHGDELAMILLPGVQYYTGQVLPIQELTRAGHAVGAKVGFDLAHSVGNVMLELHDWGVDFAAWCTYKYLNSGPGGVAGAFVHNRYIADQSLNKFLGWWGTNPKTRFEMANEFDAIPTVDSWQLSNGPVLQMAALRASLDTIDRAGGMTALRGKSELQIRYMDYMLDTVIGGRVSNITPKPMAERGCQFALRVTDPNIEGKAVFDKLEEAGVACDWRYPDVIRVAPVPLYNSFGDIFDFVQILDGLV